MSLDRIENFLCPYCGENNMLSVDVTGGSHQEFVVDCEVCCNPILVSLKIRSGQIAAIDVRKENE